ncbi:MAG: S8 family peptidase [Thermoplasmatota archaeon]
MKLHWLVLAILVVAPAADALNIATKGIRARSSEEFSPETAWDLGIYGCDVTIAIFDEGVDDAHPHLDGKVAAGVDVTATGIVWNNVNDGNPQPILGTHGTPVAGLAVSHAGKPFFHAEDFPGYDEDDLVGMAPCAWMVDVQFNDILGASTSEFVAAFDWAIANKDNDWGDNDPTNDGIDIITMSWSPLDGTDGSDVLSQAANRAVEAGIVVLGSMGNSGPEYQPWGTPAAADLSLGIANLWNERTIDRSDDVIRESSTIGPRPDDGDDNPYDELKPDVATPGHGVIGPVAGNADGSEYAIAGCGEDSIAPVDVSLILSCTAGFSGTSAATPMTAGVVALMLDANQNLTAADIKEILHQTAIPHKDQTPSAPEINAVYNHVYGWGMTDAYGAVKMAMTWPGMELGADTDSDGVRNYRDAEPFNPAVKTIIAPAPEIKETPLPPAQDADGDGVTNDVDDDPLDPTVQSGGTTGESNDTPFIGIGCVLLGLAVVMRRR